MVFDVQFFGASYLADGVAIITMTIIGYTVDTIIMITAPLICSLPDPQIAV